MNCSHAGIGAVALIFLLNASAPAQSLGSPSFDVASIRDIDPHAKSFIRATFVSPSGLIKMSYISPRALILYAYDLNIHQTADAPDWSDSTFYDIEAKTEEGTSEDRVKQMCQTLLMQRFGLKFHRSVRTASIYALAIDKGGLNILTSPSGSRQVDTSRLGRIVGSNMPISRLALHLSDYLDLPVVDKTGATGNYDYELLWSPESPARRGGGDSSNVGQERPTIPGNPSASRRFTLDDSLSGALRKLGLRIDRQKGEIEMFLIDRLDKPSEN